jgi:hypothetical protein
VSQKRIPFQEVMYGPETHAVPVIKGWSNLLRDNVLNSNELAVGDVVNVLTLPNSKFYLEKTDIEDAVLISEITLSHILFSGLEWEVANVQQD